MPDLPIAFNATEQLALRVLYYLNFLTSFLVRSYYFLASWLLASLRLCLYAPPMRSMPRKFASEDDLYLAAINGLARRAYSVYEMRTYLERRADDKDVVRIVLDRLKHLNYLDDARYARQFVRLRAELRKQGVISHRA